MSICMWHAQQLFTHIIMHSPRVQGKTTAAPKASESTSTTTPNPASTPQPPPPYTAAPPGSPPLSDTSALLKDGTRRKSLDSLPPYDSGNNENAIWRKDMSRTQGE
ncbi:hypothetical protein EJ02DRAFT_455631 [Clathrospora elynae]|uniref:Uncharacterized protein n=1 Tax=Clathrospora elynae TaxID=706981 RepID=A0A6A5SLF3_9PLEO|nr:hypothetical protein EJ02DRAFT_455631 [Clathrospora elynae]